MNIVYIGAFRLPNLDAAAPRVLNNAKILRSLGHNVYFISWGGRYRNEDICEDGKFRVCGFEYTISGDLPSGNSIKERIVTKLMRGKHSMKLLKSMNKPDIIIIYNADNAFTNKMICYCKKYNIKLINDINEWFDNKELHIQDIIPNYINMMYTQHKVKNKIVISSFFNNYYSDSNNIVVPPLCDPEEAKWSNKVNDERVKQFDGITLIYAGIPGKKDSIHSVINAVNIMANEGYSIRFLILGLTFEAYMNEYSKLLKIKSLHKNIIFLGKMSQDLIPAYYKKADFMVLLRKPNKKNMAGFPTKVAEAMTAGVPVITNDTSDLTKYIFDGKTGFIVNGYNYEDILYTLKNRVSKLSKSDIINMKNYVLDSNKDFNWRTQINKFRIFIENLI